MYIPDLMAKIKEVDALKKRIEEMESSVKDDPDVVKASKELSKRRDAIIDEVCRKDAEYSRLSMHAERPSRPHMRRKVRNPSSRLDSLYNGVGR